MLMTIFFLLIGLTLLVVFSNIFVDAASSLANSFKIPKMVIGLTIAAFGTCTPELAISFNSILEKSYDITISNVIGSCIINILLIIGLASIVKAIKIKTITVKNELTLLLITTITFAILFLDNTLSKADALILIIFFIVLGLYLYNMIKHFKKTEIEQPKYSKIMALIITILSIATITVASDIVVNSTMAIAESFNISIKIITMTIIVIGTSLPELMITVSSAKKGEFDITVGNIIGTNIFNICIVLGVPTLLFGPITTNAFNYFDLIFLVLAATFFFIFSKSNRAISKKEGSIMLLTFIIYYTYLFLSKKKISLLYESLI